MLAQRTPAVDPAASPRPRPSKLSHRKSRFGCQRCRQRRVKCSETKPICDHCQRHRTACFYDRLPPHTPSSSSSSVVPAAPVLLSTAEARVAAAAALLARSAPGSTSASDSSSAASSSCSSSSSLPTDDIPEGPERRVTELRLMHHYLTSTGATVAIDAKTRHLYATLIPKLALESDALLFCLHSLAALHLAVLGHEGEPVAVDTHQRYLSMALREHNKALANIGPANADVVCLTSAMVRVSSFTLLQDRARQPYEPPVGWLMMNASTSAVLHAAFTAVDGSRASVAHVMLTATPVIADEERRFGERWRRGLEHLTARVHDRDRDEPWDPDTEDAYQTTLSYLGSAVDAARHGEASEVCRRLVIFPMLVKPRFTELVQEGRPRAILLLAYYFALLSLYEHVWWIGGAGASEVRAIADTLTGHWKEMMRWPLDVVEQGKLLPFSPQPAHT